MDATPRVSERHFAELIAQKQRLQQLESEYALKIQMLKEAQALRNRGVLSDLPAELAVRPSTPPDAQNPPPSTFPLPPPLPQPSLHDLTQDKLILDSEDAPEADDHEPESAAGVGGRRHSFRQNSNSSTKPNLEQLSSTPSKDNSATKPAKTPTSSRSPAEVFAGLDVDALKARYQQRARLGELLLRELHRLGGHVDGPPAGQVNMHGTAPRFLHRAAV